MQAFIIYDQLTTTPARTHLRVFFYQGSNPGDWLWAADLQFGVSPIDCVGLAGTLPYLVGGDQGSVPCIVSGATIEWV